MSLLQRLRSLERRARTRGVTAGGPMISALLPDHKALARMAETLRARGARESAVAYYERLGQWPRFARADGERSGTVKRWQREEGEAGQAFVDRVCADAEAVAEGCPM